VEKFSERLGFMLKKNILQVNSMDDDLRNGLWNALTIHYWDELDTEDGGTYLEFNKKMRELIRTIWADLLKEPIDQLEDYWPNTRETIRSLFYKFDWSKVYDFVEFIPNNYRDDDSNSQFIGCCNNLFERELSTYRFINKQLTPITGKEELTEIEKAANISDEWISVRTHLSRSLELFSDRKTPDYRNAIKESISAVKALCKKITK